MLTFRKGGLNGRLRHQWTMTYNTTASHTPNIRTARTFEPPGLAHRRGSDPLGEAMDHRSARRQESCCHDTWARRPGARPIDARSSGNTSYRTASRGQLQRAKSTKWDFSSPESQDLTVVGSIPVVTKANRVSPHFERCPPRTAWMRRQPR